jgi:hypothetical protein
MLHESHAHISSQLHYVHLVDISTGYSAVNSTERTGNWNEYGKAFICSVGIAYSMVGEQAKEVHFFVQKCT